MLNSTLVNKDFLTWLLIGRRLCCQPIRCQVWKSLLPNMDFNMKIYPSNPGPWSPHLRSNLTMPWWRHQMETFSALLAICAGNSPVSGEFPTQRPSTRSFDVFFFLRLNKRLSKQSWGWWFETLSCPLWRHRNGVTNKPFTVYDVIMASYVSWDCKQMLWLSVNTPQ